MPATTGHTSQSLKQCQSYNNISVNETKRPAATPHIGSTAKPRKWVWSQICIRKHSSIAVWHCECPLYLRSEFTPTANLSRQPGGTDISLDRTIVLLHKTLNFFSLLSVFGGWSWLLSVWRDFGTVFSHGVSSIWFYQVLNPSFIVALTVEYLLGNMLEECLPIEISHC